MKKMGIAILAIGLLAGLAAPMAQAQEKQQQGEVLEGTITLSGAWALYPMVVRWAEEFQGIHPKVKIDIGAGGAGKGMADCLAEVVDIGMVSRAVYPEEVKKGAWWVSVTKDAVVPTVNLDNPVIEALLAHGVTMEDCRKIWISGEISTWGAITGSDVSHIIRVYTRSDACGAAQTWADYLGGNQEDLLGVGVYGDPGLAEAVRKDILGVGFNNINYVYDAKTKKQVEGIKILPLDLDGDGKIAEDEAFYEDRDAIVQAIAMGKYPSPPARDLHFVCHGKPERKVVCEFIKWVLTDGQQYVPESGYINLTGERLAQEMIKLAGE